MAFSTYLAGKVIDHLLRNQAYTPPATVYASLHTADPGNTGASEVAGMGIKFLRHISRTAGLALLIALSDDRYLDAYDILCKELEAYEPGLLNKQQVIIGTKTDEPGTAQRLEELKRKYADKEVIGLCVYLDMGVEDVRQAFIRMVTRNEDAASKALHASAQGGFSSTVDLDAYYPLENESQ